MPQERGEEGVSCILRSRSKRTERARRCWVLLSRFCAGFDTRSPSSGSECDPTLQQGGGILTLVLLLSLGLWALIWGAVSLLAAYEMR